MKSLWRKIRTKNRTIDFLDCRRHLIEVGHLQLPKFEIERFSFVHDISTRLFVFYADIVEHHPAGTEVIQRLKADARVAALYGKMISSGSVASMFEIKRLAMWFLWLANESGLDIANASLERFLTDESISILNTLWILGISVEAPVDLVEGYKILPIEKMPDSREKDEFSKLGTHQFGDITNQPKAAIVKECLVLKTSPNELAQLGTGSELLSTQKQLLDISLLLNSLPQISCTSHFQTAYPSNAPFGPFGGSSGGIYSPDVPSRNNTICTLEHASQLCELIKVFSRKAASEQIRLHRILHRIAQAKKRMQIEDKILDLSIALEMLLLGDNGNNDQLSLSFRLRGSWLLGSDASSRSELYKQFRDLYGYRCQVAHSGILCKGNAQEIQAVWRNFDSYASLAERVVQKVIRDGTPDWTQKLLGAT